MLWAPIHRLKWDELPDEWEVVINAHKYLQKYVLNYQLIMERSMFNGGKPVEIRCVLIRWEPKQGFNQRDVLFETTDPKHAELILTVLISEAKHDSQRG